MSTTSLLLLRHRCCPYRVMSRRCVSWPNNWLAKARDGGIDLAADDGLLTMATACVDVIPMFPLCTMTLDHGDHRLSRL